jgi:hypothetical protein
MISNDPKSLESRMTDIHAGSIYQMCSDYGAKQPFGYAFGYKSQTSPTIDPKTQANEKQKWIK